MYDYSGQFAFNVGLPAKSGVSGSLLIVVPNLCGICCYGPPLDQIGNSTKGVKFAKELVNRFCFHNFDNLKALGTSGEAKKDPRREMKNQCENFSVVAVLFAAQEGDVKTIMRYHLSGFDLNMSDYDNRTALRVEVLKFKVQKKITNILIVIVQPQHQAPGFENMIKIYPDLFKFNPNLSK